jgi:uncharacterized protein (DUF1330 family)
MAAYVVFLREGPVHNQAEMDKYRSGNRDSNKGFNLKPLCVYGAMETVEGAPTDGVVVLEFPTVEEARAWYHSPAYQEAAKHRKAAADYRAFIVEGFDPSAFRG